MARKPTITLEQVAAIADRIKAQGGRPTATKVRDEHGTGSMGTVIKHLRQWADGQVQQSQVSCDSLDPIVVRVISNQISSKVQEATVAATSHLADLQVEMDALIADNERQVADIDLLAIDFTALQELYAALLGRTQQLETDATRNAASLVVERAAVESARVELAKAELRLEAVPRVEAEVEKVRSELLEMRSQAAKLHEAAAVSIAKLEAEIKQHKSTEAQLAEAVRLREVAENRALTATEALSNERVAMSRAEAKKAGEEAAEFRSQLASGKTVLNN